MGNKKSVHFLCVIIKETIFFQILIRIFQFHFIDIIWIFFNYMSERNLMKDDTLRRCNKNIFHSNSFLPKKRMHIISADSQTNKQILLPNAIWVKPTKKKNVKERKKIPAGNWELLRARRLRCHETKEGVPPIGSRRLIQIKITIKVDLLERSRE